MRSLIMWALAIRAHNSNWLIIICLKTIRFRYLKSTLVLKLRVENQLKEAAEKSALPTLDLCKLDMNRGANPLLLGSSIGKREWGAQIPRLIQTKQRVKKELSNADFAHFASSCLIFLHMENWTLFAAAAQAHLLKIEIIEVSKLCFEANEDFLEAQIEQFENNPLVTLHGLHF